MAGITGPVTVTDQDIRTTYVSRGSALLGQKAQTSDGKTFNYSANTSTSLALTPGKLTQGAVASGNHLNRTGVVYAAGTSQVVFTIGNTAITTDQYTQGYFVVNKVTGAGQTLQITSHNTPAGNGSVTVNLMDYIITATDTTSKFSLYPNITAACLLYAHASPNTSIPTGVPAISVPAATTANPSTYFWAQTGGVCAVLADAATWVGTFDGVIASTLTDGAVGIQAAATIQPTLGYALDTLVSTEFRPVMFTGMVV
jgi:hypothetical protein